MAKISIQLSTGTTQTKETIVGIDLGTTNSLIAIIHPDTKKAIALKEIDNSILVPSVIHFNKNGNIEIGNQALPFLETDAARTIYSIKRLIGKSYQEINTANETFSYEIIENTTSDNMVKIKIDNQFYSPIELSSLILKELKKRAEHILKTPISKCVITVPAYFNDAQRQATRDAGKFAGLEVLRIINEPTAASLAYGLGTSTKDEKIIAVYDLGGGTFDISILKIKNGIFDVLSTNGDTHLGGDDFDNCLIALIDAKLTTKVNLNKEHQQVKRLLAEKIKKQLSTTEKVDEEFFGQSFTITKKEFEESILNLVQKTIVSCKNALKDADLEKEDIDVVVMVGGSTRIPFIQEKVKQFFNVELYNNINPDEIVALGAAVQADILSGNTHDLLLLDVTPLSLGIETMGGLMDVLIERNSKIPTQAHREYTTQKDGQSGIEIAVYQGERDLVKDNRKLSEFVLKNIPAMPAGIPKVDIKFTLNADGILEVKAKELRSGVEQTVLLEPKQNLKDEDVEKMLLDSITNAKEDIAARALAEAKTEARQMIDTTDRFIKKHAQYISTVEIKETEMAIKNLNDHLKTEDKNAILASTEDLNKISAVYAEKVMDIAVAEALKGKNV
ncbi:MAG: Fe-S protein assembly chaperone HscA [Chitinophagaceae bacterium]|nr:Fe-S protein assembly chaperone HscA [Chitinophagaceae bacterium]